MHIPSHRLNQNWFSKSTKNDKKIMTKNNVHAGSE